MFSVFFLRYAPVNTWKAFEQFPEELRKGQV